MNDNEYGKLLRRLLRLKKQENYEKIAEVLEEIPEDERDLGLDMLLANSYIILEKYSEAIDVLEGYEPEDNDEYYLNLGTAYYYLENYDEAIPYLEKAHLLNPDDVDNLMFLCIALSEYGDEERFEEYSEKLKELDEDCYDSYFNSQAYSNESYSDEEADTVELFIADRLGQCEKALCSTTDDISFDILIIPPDEERDFYTLVTCGMGAHKMNIPDDVEYEFDRAELIFCLPDKWHFGTANDRWFWPLYLMQQLVQLSINKHAWLACGHTVSSKAPYSGDTELCGAILGDSPLLDGENYVILPSGDKVRFYQIYPLYREEIAYKLDNGAEAMLELIDEQDYVLDMKRKNLVEDVLAHGFAFATDRVTKDGEKIGLMYRDKPLDNFDSGWRFYAGDEDEEYVRDPSKSGLHTLTSLCKSNPEIKELLDLPCGSAFARNKNGRLVRVKF